MKIIHTADLHLGQVIYQNYDRADEHRHFFHQLARDGTGRVVQIVGDQPAETVVKLPDIH